MSFTILSGFLVWTFLKVQNFFLTLMFVKTIEFNSNQSCKLVINSVIDDIKNVLD